ncbi:MAG: helix-turn-helix domain-containing protein [Oscillospiraceae bacterium]|nr:helix-turn-helix domain-containing protein [Oscillospiraceae bacterium]
MYIQLDRLADMMKSRVSVRGYNISSQVVKGIEMFPIRYDPAATPLEPDVLYVCDYRKLRYYDPHLSFPPLVCVLEPGAKIDEIFFSDRVVMLVSGIAVTELMAQLVEIAYTIGGESSPLVEESRSLVACHGIQELMQTGLRLLGNPLVLADESQHILAWADNGNTVSPLRRVIDLGYLPEGHPMLELAPRAPDENNYPIIVQGTENDGVELPTVMVKRLLAGGRLTGSLHVFQYDREFSPEDANVVELLGNLLAMELRRMPERRGMDSRRWEIDHFFQDILENAHDEESIRERQEKIGLKFEPFIYTVIVYNHKQELLPGISAHELAKQMSALLPNCTGFLFRNSIFMILSTDQEVLGDSFFEPIAPLLEKYGMIAGVSNPFVSLTQLRKNGFQSRKALQLGVRLKKERLIHFFRDYSIHYMVELCLKSEEASTFCLPEVVRLINHEDKSGGDLLITLKTYLRCGRNKSQTAKELFLHLNTVKYRLMQINDIMGLDLDDDDNALKIMLTFKILEYQEEFQAYEPMNM